MAKYDVKAACGCEYVEVLFGKVAERLKRIKYLETQDCPECRKKKHLEKAISKTVGLPELQGTQKQIDWATLIRAEKIDNLNFLLCHIDTFRPKNYEKQRELVLSVINNDSASFWINNRLELFGFSWLAEKMLWEF